MAQTGEGTLFYDGNRGTVKFDFEDKAHFRIVTFTSAAPPLKPFDECQIQTPDGKMIHFFIVKGERIGVLLVSNLADWPKT